jgi:putative transposase
VTQAFEVPKSCYYKHLQTKESRSMKDAQYKQTLHELFYQSRRADGSRSLVHKMRAKGHQIGRFKVRKLMRDMHLQSKQPKPRHHSYRVVSTHAPNILSRQFEVSHANQVWTGDMTYLWAEGKWVYLAVVLDLSARRVVGWAMSEKPDAALVARALKMAMELRGHPQSVLFHSDQGVQYSSAIFKGMLAQFGMTQSMSRRGNCWDNAPTERLFRSLKSEWIPPLGYESLEFAITDVGYYLMVYYNHQRPHAANSGLTPNDAEKLINVSNFT